MPRAVVLVFDSLGIGAAPDAVRFGDVGADTLGHVARHAAQQGRPLRLPQLGALGLAHAAQLATGSWPEGLDRGPLRPGLRYAACAERSADKDTPSGHWEMMGCPVTQPWGTFASAPAGQSVFPPEAMRRWLQAAGLGGSLGNTHASGTEIIARLGDAHVQSGWPICYTSADSVFQVAAHETHFGLQRLLDVCALAKPIFDEWRIARVIARPFAGVSGAYVRTANRVDLTTPPPAPTVLDVLADAGHAVFSVGKIADIFAHRHTGEVIKADGNAALFEATLQALARCPDGGLVMCNLVDFDMRFGHRRDPEGYGRALQDMDARLPQLLQRLRHDDLLAITADHGCDPTWPGSDHTREHVPLLLHCPRWTDAVSEGVRADFGGLAEHVLAHLQLPKNTSMILSNTC